jgi:hypothetical protein
MKLHEFEVSRPPKPRTYPTTPSPPTKPVVVKAINPEHAVKVVQELLSDNKVFNGMEWRGQIGNNAILFYTENKEHKLVVQSKEAWAFSIAEKSWKPLTKV